MVYEDDLPIYADVVSVEKKYSHQINKYYKEVNYADGNFRQFNLDTSELIGSSYQEDQKYLPNLE